MIREVTLEDTNIIKEKIKKNPEYLHPCNKERQEDMKKLKFSGYEYSCWLNKLLKKEKRKMNLYERLKNDFGNEFAEWAKNNIDKVRKCVLCSGSKTETEYLNKLAQKRGYKDNAEIKRKRFYDNGVRSPPSDNEYCSDYLGKYIGEELFKRFLEEVIFEHVNKIGRGSYDKGIDFYCRNPRQEFINKYPQFRLEKNKEYSFQLKVKCLTYKDKRIYWAFNIGYNKNPDYFILCGFDNREQLNSLHIWIFRKDDIIGEEKFWKRNGLYITNRSEYLAEFKNYELKDELEKLKEILKELKKEL